MDKQQPSEIDQLVELATRNSVQLGAIFGQHRERLKRIVSASLDPRVKVRVDASDVIQETFLEAIARIDEYLKVPRVSLFVWLRFLAKQRLALLHRKHLRVQGRNARRELAIDWGVENHSSRVQLAVQLAAKLTTASAALSRKEGKRKIESALEKLDGKSREVLMLRHFEQLSNVESAEVLQISPTAACNRYVRALERLKKLLDPSEKTP